MPRTLVRRLALAVLLLAVAARAETPLIPREALFGNPERSRPALSPDGKRLAWLQPDKGILQVWVQTLGKDDATAVSADRQRPIRRFQWGQDSRTLLYLQDVKGNEDWHVYGVDVESRQVRDLTPFDGVHAELVADSPRPASEVLVALNLQDRARMDVHRIDVRSGAVTLDTRNPGTVTTWAATDDLVVKAGVATRSDGGEELLVRDSAKGAWRILTRGGPDDTLELLDLTADGKSVLYVNSAGAATARVVQRALSGGAEKVLASNPEVDTDRRLRPPDAARGRGRGVRAGAPRMDPARPDGEEGLRRLPSPRDVDSRRSSHATAPTGPGSWPSATRRARRGISRSTARRCREAPVRRPAEARIGPLAEMKPVHFAARDGLALQGYLTRPVGASAAGPMVLLVHGGPWGRDHWKLDPSAQWLANRGYAVLQINFRGSTGYGRKFMSAGNRQWGKDMQTDLLDARGLGGQGGRGAEGSRGDHGGELRRVCDARRRLPSTRTCSAVAWTSSVRRTSSRCCARSPPTGSR
jgi:dipeptidyl aminopeptidase/acylaminoacyl peptidase